MVSIFLIYISFNKSEYSNYYSLFGGTLLGAVLGTIFGKVSSEETHDEIHGINEKIDKLLSIYSFEFYEKINSMFYFSFNENEKSLRSYRNVVHKYHKTRDVGGEFWIYRKIDFSKIPVPGKLYAKQTISIEKRAHNHLEIKNYDYEYEGFIFGNRLVITVTPNNNEDVTIEIFKDYGVSLPINNCYCGVQLHNDWMRNDCWDRVIISDVPLFDLDCNQIYLGYQGRVPQDIANKLDEQWISIAPKVGMR